MKRLVLLSLLLFPIFLFAQYPTFSNKQKLGVQTTGDGLIFRGTTVNNIPNYIPSNVNNAYFHLDTTTSKLYLYSVNTWQQIYPTASDTTSLSAYLLKSDTLAMLLPYLRKADTISLSNRINLKLNISDTTILSNRITTNANNIIIINNKLATKLDTIYTKFKDVVTMIENKDTINIGSSLTDGYGINIIGDSVNVDTTIIFTQSDTITLSNRIDNKLNVSDTVSLSNRIDLKLNKTDTINLSNRIDLKLNKSDTISLSNRIDIKLNASDTVSLSNRINTKLDTIYVNYQTSIDTIVNKDTINITTLEAGAGINITNNVISLDTTLLDSVVRVQNVYVKNGTGTVLNKGEAVYVTGANGTNIIVGRASNVAESSSSKTLGLTMTSIAIDGFGYVVKEGLLAGLNTNSADSAGVPIWLGVNGALIYGLNNKPYAPNHLVYLGVVTRKQQNNGEVYVTVQNGFEIKELHDVQILSPVNKASLYYNLSESLWRDTTAALLVSDTVSMLSKYVNTYSNQTGINGDKTFNNVVTIDSATITGKLLVNTNISDAVKISSNTNSTNLELMNSSGTVSIKSSNKNMILQTDTTALVYLNGNNKKVGILTMNPQQELEVAGNVRIDSLNNNIVPTRMVGSDNNGDLTNVNLGEGLSFVNDTLKVDLTIIDTAIAASSITLAGHVTGTGSTNSTVNTTISNNVVTNDMLTGGISDTKLNTITTTGKVDNSATTATSSNIANTIVLRDNNRDFTARNITATNFYGLASTATLANTIQSSNTTGIIKLTTSSNSVLPIITVPDVNAAMATTNLSQTFGGTQTFSNTISGSINGNAATVTSVLPSNFASQTANTVLAAPNGSNGTPTFRSLVSSDIPSLNYLPLSGGTTSGLITSSFTNTTNYSTSATNNNAFTIYNNTTSTNNIYGGLQFLIGENSGSIPGGPGLAQIYGIRAGGASNPSTDLTFSTKSSVTGVLEKMRIKFDGKVGIGTTAPSYLLDVNGTFNASGNSLIGGTLGVSGVTTLSNLIGTGTRMVTASSTGVLSTTTIPTGTIDGSGTTNYLPKFTGTSTLGSSGLFRDVNRFSINEGTDQSFGWDFMGNTSNPFIGNNVKTSTTFERVERMASTTLFNPAAIIFGYQRVNNSSGAVSFGGMNFMTTSGNLAGDINPITYSRMFIEPDGNIGIGTMQPSYKFDIRGTLGVTGETTLSNLGGNGNRMVITNNSGTLSTQAIPAGTLVGTDTVSLSNRINTKVGLTGDEYINGQKTFGGLIIPSNGMQLTATGNNSNKLIGINTSSYVGEVTLGSGLSLSNNILSVTTTSGGFVTTNSDYAVTITDTWIVFNNNFSNITVTLPNAATSTGRTLYFRNTAAGSIVSAGTANIIDNTVTIGTPNNNILGAGNTNVKWCTLVSNGTYWIKMQAGSL